jgi:hypothetical protein
MDKLIYALCTLTAALCALLLLRGYLRTRFRLLLWSGACFVGLTANNVLLVLDRIVLPDVDLLPWRLCVALAAVLLLVFGLVIEGDAR